MPREKRFKARIVALSRLVALFMVSIVLMAPATLAQKKGTKDLPPPVPVFVTSTGAVGGLTDPSKDNQDAVKDITDALKKSEFITLVKSRDEARLVVVVQGRELGEVGPLGRDFNLRAALQFSGNSADLRASVNGGAVITNNAWKRAAFKIADQVHRWVQDNRVALQ